MTSICLPLAVALALCCAGPTVAVAHEGGAGPQGGVMIDVENHHVEFVPSPSGLTFYLSDAKDAPVAAAGAKMKAIVQDGGKTIQHELTPAEPNKLTAPLPAALSPGAKVVISGTLPDGTRLQARFVVP